jgi:hypothetical protein
MQTLSSLRRELEQLRKARAWRPNNHPIDAPQTASKLAAILAEPSVDTPLRAQLLPIFERAAMRRDIDLYV